MTKPSGGTLILRALRLRCPRCGGAPMFAGLFRMHESCAACGLKFEREPGYFLGSIYLNYGMTALLLTVGYVSLHFGLGIDSRKVLLVGGAFCVLFPLFYFRYARALWLAMDCRFDSSLFSDDTFPERIARHERE